MSGSRPPIMGRAKISTPTPTTTGLGRAHGRCGQGLRLHDPGLPRLSILSTACRHRARLRCEPPRCAGTAHRQNRGKYPGMGVSFADLPALLVDNRDNRPPRRWRATRAYTEGQRITRPRPCAFPLNSSMSCARGFRFRRSSAGGCG